MACLEHNGKKYTKGQFKKEILKSPEDFAMHVLDDEDVKHFALDEAPATDKKMSEFDELLDAKKGIDTIEIPAEIQKQLEDAATNLTPEETEALDGFGSALESARNAGGAEDKGPAENSAPEDNGTDGGKTIEPVAEDAQGEKPKDKSGGLRKGTVSKGEGDKSAKGVKTKGGKIEKPVMDAKKFVRENRRKTKHKGNTEQLNKINDNKKWAKNSADIEPANIHEFVAMYFADGGQLNSEDFAREVFAAKTPEYKNSEAHSPTAIMLDRLSQAMAESWHTDHGGDVSTLDFQKHILELAAEDKGDLRKELLDTHNERKFAEENGGVTQRQMDEAQHLYEEEQAMLSHYGLDAETAEPIYDEIDERILTPEEAEQEAKEYDEWAKNNPEKEKEFFVNSQYGNEAGTNQGAESETNAENKGIGENAKRSREELQKEVAEKKAISDKATADYEAGKASLEKNLTSKQQDIFAKGKAGEGMFGDDTTEKSKAVESLKTKADEAQAEYNTVQNLLDEELKGQQDMFGPKFQKSSTSEPITRAKLTQAITRLKKLFPNIEITNDSREWNEALSKASPEEMKQTPNGFIYKGKMYLNPDIDMIKGDTVAHETQHIANEVMKAKAPEKWEQGVKLALQEGAIEKLRESYPHLMSDEAIADEFIADAVGKRVEQLDQELKQKGIPERIINQITDWVEQAKDWIYDKLGYTPDMTFGEFVDNAAKLQVRGKEISDISTGDKGPQFQITDEEAQKMAFGKVPTDDKTIDTSMAPEAKAETIPGSTTATYHAETRKDLIGALKEAGLWDKKNVSTFDNDGNVLKVGEKRKPADEQKSIDTLRGAINDLIKKIDPKLHTEDGRDNKKSFQLDLENLRDELSDKKTIPVLKEILKDLSGEQKLLDIPKEDLTKAQRKAQKFYTDVMQLKKQAAYIEETKGSVITSETSHIPKGTVVEQSTKEFNGRFPGFEKYKDAPILKNVIPYIEKYVRATSGVRGFGKWLTGKSDGLINAATKALSQAPGKAFRIKETAEKLTKPLFDKNGYETRSTYESKEGFEKTKPVDINTVAKGIAPEGTVVSPKELNDIYLTLRQPEVNRTYFSNERDAARLEKDIAPKEKELADLKAKDQAQLDQREKNAIDESIENLSEEIEKTRGEIEDLKKNVQGFTLQAIDGVRPETTFKISSEHFGKIRDYARGEFGEQVSGWEQATKFIHPFLNQAFKMENGVALAEHEKFYPLTHGKPNEVRSYTKQQKFIDDFRSAKYRNPAIEGNNYLVISSDIKMQSYINSAAKYSAYSTPIRNMDAVMNGLEGTVSKDDQEWWNKQKAHAEDPNRFSGLIGEMGEFEKKLYAGFSTSVLGLNPFIPPKEIGAVFLGTSEIDSKYLLPQVPKLVGGLGKLLKSFNPMALRTYDATEQEMMQHNDMANMRLQSGVTDYAELSNEMGKVKIPGTEKEVDLSKATEPMLMAHRMVQKAYWTAAKAKIDAEQPELKGDAYWKAVGDIYEKVTLATQPSIDTFNSPSFRKETNPLTRVLSIYAGQSFVNMNNLMGKTLEYMHDPSNANAKLAVAKSATNIFIVNALMLTAIDALRPGGKKDDKNEITLDALKNVSKSIPIFSPIIDAIINKYKSPAFGYGLELPIMEIGNEMTSGLASVAHGKFDRGIDDMIKAAAAYKGVPIMPYEEAKRVLR